MRSPTTASRRPLRTGRARLVALAALAGAASLAREARGQDRPCAEGRVRTAQSQGRCCWPGQTWLAPLARCDGPPQCPEGYVEEGDQCTRASGAPVVAPARTPVFPVASAPPSAPALAPVAPRAEGAAPSRPFVGRLPDGTLRYGVLPEPGESVAPELSRVPAAPPPAPPAPPPVVQSAWSTEPAPAPPPVSAPAPPAVVAPPPSRRLVEVREPYTGGPVPPGARVEARVHVPLLVSGLATFVVGYVWSFGGAVDPAYYPYQAYVVVPFAGALLTPMLRRAQYDVEYLGRTGTVTRAQIDAFYRTYNAHLATFFVPSLVLQVAGASLTVAGAALRQRTLVSTRPAARGVARALEALAVAPYSEPTSFGLVVAGAF